MYVISYNHKIVGHGPFLPGACKSSSGQAGEDWERKPR